MEDLQKSFRSLSEEFQAIRKGLLTSNQARLNWLTIGKDIAPVIEARQKLESQLQENKNVQKEFAGLKDNANVYKLIGPVLLKQDRAEAVMNVDKRLEFIEGEMFDLYPSIEIFRYVEDTKSLDSKRIEGQIKDLGQKQEKKKVELLQMQQAIQMQQSGQSEA